MFDEDRVEVSARQLTAAMDSVAQALQKTNVELGRIADLLQQAYENEHGSFVDPDEYSGVDHE